MKKERISLSPYYEILYMACLAAGLLLTADSLGGFSFSTPLLPAGALLFLLFFHYPGGRGLRPALLCGFLLLHALVFLYLRHKQADPEPFRQFLGMEAACLLAAYICHLAARRLWMKGILVLLETGLLIALSLMRLPLPKWGVCLIVFAGFLFLAELNSSSAYSLLPVLAGIMLLFSFLPVKETPIRWETFQKAAGLVSEKARALIVSLKYSFSDNALYSVSFTGYNPDGELGGNLFFSNNAQISVRGSQTNDPLYLAGTIYNTYTGNGWKTQDAPVPYKTDSYSLQYRKLLSIFQDTETEKYTSELTHSCQMAVEYDGLKTKSIFYAPNTLNFDFDVNTARDLSGANLLLKRGKGVGFTYNLRYLEIDYSNKKVQELLSSGSSAKPVPATQKDAGEQNAYSQYCRENYSSLPNSLPKKVRLLAEDLTGNSASDYEKMKALETYLRQFPYTTNPGNPPKGEDFTEAFLFDSREGYCTYFATAIAVLGRCVGIPTRYVEGFATRDTQSVEDRSISVTGKNAHAWAEAYLEPVGWVVFDPTPGYGQTSDPWNSPETDTDTAPGASPSNAPYGGSSDLSKEGPEEKVSRASASYARLVSLLPLLVKGLAAALIMAGALALFLLLRIRFRRHFYKKLSEYDKILRLMERILLIGKWKGRRMEDSETLSDYEMRLSGMLDVEGMSFAQICSIFQRIRFGPGKAPAGDRTNMEGYVKTLQSQFLQNCGKLKALSFALRN